MIFTVKRSATYKLDKESIKTFKEGMLEYLKDEMYEAEELKENEELSYTIEDISDDIVKDALTDVIQGAFEDPQYYQGGITFDDYFESAWLDCSEDDIRDCIYEAVAAWRDEMEDYETEEPNIPKDKIMVAVLDYGYYIKHGSYPEDYNASYAHESYIFNTPEEFIKKWYELDEGAWYWVFVYGEEICSGALDPDDIETFEYHFNMSFEEE